jgi:small-conductance mechanosensitive channel
MGLGFARGTFMTKRIENRKKRETAIKSMQLHVEKDGRATMYHRRSLRRFSPVAYAKRGDRYALKVIYSDGSCNESAWYDTKKELYHAMRCFTEPSLLEEFVT